MWSWATEIGRLLRRRRLEVGPRCRPCPDEQLKSLLKGSLQRTSPFLTYLPTFFVENPYDGCMSKSISTALLEFRAENVSSFKEAIHLSMRGSVFSKPDVLQVVSSNAKNKKPLTALPVLAILGANASGKSNALKAIRQMRNMVLGSFKAAPESQIPRTRFKGLGPEAPSKFEVEIIIDGIWYLYGYEINDHVVLNEWAFYTPNGVKARLFERVGQEKVLTRAQNKREWSVAETLMRPNSLYLSACAQIEHPDTRPLFEWFRNNLRYTEAGQVQNDKVTTLESFKSPETKAVALALLQAADFGITNLKITKPEPEVSEAVKRLWKFMNDDGLLSDKKHSTDSHPMPPLPDNISFLHRLGDDILQFDSTEESQGTLTWFSTIGWVLTALTNGSVLVIDEFGASLHSNLILEIIRLFQNPAVNTKFAQLIFTSHSLIVLSPSPGGTLLGRDQILIVEKDNFGCSSIFPLSDLSVRNDEPLMKRYMEGLYGGIPILDFERVSSVLNMKTPE